MLVAQHSTTHDLSCTVPNTERVGSVKDLRYLPISLCRTSYFLMGLCLQGTYINKRVKAHDAEEDNSESDDDEFRWVRTIDRLRMELDLQSLFGILVYDPDSPPPPRVGKNPGFFKKTQPSGFFWFFWGFLVFFVFFWFFWAFCPDERILRVFFSFTNTFRCIQTLNYNHSY